MGKGPIKKGASDQAVGGGRIKLYVYGVALIVRGGKREGHEKDGG